MSHHSMRARVLGAVRLEAGSVRRAFPTGRVGALLRFLLLRPNETHPVARLAGSLWPEVGDEETARSRLQVTVSRLRRFLGDDPDGTGGLRVVTERDGYRLEAGSETLDRVAFEDRAQRTLAGEPHLAGEALACWEGDPYTGFPWSEEVERQRRRLGELRTAVEETQTAERRPEASGAEIARTRLRPPRIGPEIIPRRRLLDGLPAAGEVGVITVVAPAGYGKSLLLAQWAAEQTAPVAWLTLDGDDDPDRCRSAVVQALLEVGGTDLRRLPTGSGAGSVEDLPSASAAVAGAGTPAIVLDDAHHLAVATLRTLLGQCLSELPAAATIAIGSRRPLPIDVIEPVRSIHQVPGDSLRYDGEETAAALGVMAPSLAPSEVARIDALAGGWPVAVAHLGRSGAGSAPATEGPATRAPATETLGAHLLDEILGDLPGRTRRFLLETPILDVLEPSRCDAVTGGSGDAAGILDRLRRHGLLTVDTGSGDGEHRYRYPRFLAIELRRRADADPTVDVALHERRAAAWFRHTGHPEPALAHALRGGDTGTVTAVAGAALAAAARRGEVERARQWLHAIDPDALATAHRAHDLAVLLAAGWLDPQRRADWLESRRRWFGGDDDRVLAVADLIACVTEARVGDGLAVAETLVTAGDDLPEPLTAIADVGVATCRILVGDLGHDDPVLERVHRRLDGEPLLEAWLLADWALLAYVDGAPEQARIHLARLDTLVGPLDRPPVSRLAGLGIVVETLLDGDGATGDSRQGSLLARLAPVLEVSDGLRWRRHQIVTRLALHHTLRRGGDRFEADRHLAHADLLLRTCRGARLLHRAREVLGGGAGAVPVVPPDSGDPLTERERTVLDYLGTELTLTEIARELYVSPNTIKTHAVSIYGKLGVSNRTELARRRRR